MGDIRDVYLLVALVSTTLSVILSSIALVKELVGQGSGLYVLAESFEGLPGDVQLAVKVFVILLAVAGFLAYKSSREER